MKKYYFTQTGYDEFLVYFNTIKKTLEDATANKAECGAGSDTWHDEGFKIGVGEEMMWSQDFGKLQNILRNCVVVVPLEQNDRVLLGNGVILDVNGNEMFLLVDGYISKPTRNRISLDSPIGSALLNKTVGQEVLIKLGDISRRFLLKEILLPSAAFQKFYSEMEERKGG
jgi:transcription elongation factor GreA